MLKENGFYLFGRALPGAIGESPTELAAADLVAKNVTDALVNANNAVFLMADFLEMSLFFVFEVLVLGFCILY